MLTGVAPAAATATAIEFDPTPRICSSLAE